MKILMSFILSVVSVNMFSQSTGNVGIGTNAPVRPLHITGAGELLRIQGSFPWIGFMNNNDPSYGGFLYYPDTSLVMGSRSGTNLPLIMAPNNIGLLYATSAQRIGIGSSSPTEKLDVNGNINVTGTIKANGVQGLPNQVLGTNASGNLAWTEMSSTSSSGNVGYGSWGDCSMSNISEYLPVSDTSGHISSGYGSAVGIQGIHALVGAASDSVGLNAYQGSVIAFQFNGSNWIQTQKFADASGATGDNLGNAISVSGNFAVIGSWLDDEAAGIDQGSASVYQYNGSSWVFRQKLTDATGASNDRFGFSVDISGNYLIVGAEDDQVGANFEQGSASIYQYNGTSWVLMQKLTDATGASSDHFGHSVAISGNYAIVGSPYDNVGANSNQGSVSIYYYNGSTWVLMQKITFASGAADDYFGTSVDIEGTTAVVSAPEDDINSNANQGSVFIYRYNGSSWIMSQQLIEPTSGINFAFGEVVSFSGNYLLVGSRSDSATVFIKAGAVWQKLQLITDPGKGGLSGERFGEAVSIDGSTKRFLIGARQAGGSWGKAVFGKIN